MAKILTKKCSVAILAGGSGSRLKGISGDTPKPLVPVCGTPVLQHQIELCRRHGFKNIALLVGYKAEAIKSYFGDGSRIGVSLSYQCEKTSRGTAGALKDALPLLEDMFIVLYGDTYADIDLKTLYLSASDSTSLATLLTHPNSHPDDSDLIVSDASNKIIDISGYPHKPGNRHRNLVSAGLYVLRQQIGNYIPSLGASDLVKDTFILALQDGALLVSYPSAEYIKDMGTPDRLKRVEQDIERGVPNRRSSRMSRAAVFLDRDGTINLEKGLLTSATEIELLPGVGQAIKQLNNSGHLSICVTNQPIIARGDSTTINLSEIHKELETQLGKQGAFLDAIYYCPHHPDRGFTGEIPELKIRCDCRKPEAGMIYKAVRDLSINLRTSWMIGDSTCDILAGKRAGLKTILLGTGNGGGDRKYEAVPDFNFDTLIDAVNWITFGFEKTIRKIVPLLPSISNSRLILIGGPSKSGKTIFANALRMMLEETGRDTHLISLDSYLKPKENRKELKGVINRYDLSPLCKRLHDIVNSKKREVLEIPNFCRLKGGLGTTRELSVGSHDILIVEGVPALLADELRVLSEFSIFVNVKESVREKRIFREYRSRGMADQTIRSLIEARNEDEVHPAIMSGKSATVTIDLDGLECDSM
jgi:D,D-heptose 1,7-bisphosphate phosphatase